MKAYHFTNFLLLIVVGLAAYYLFWYSPPNPTVEMPEYWENPNFRPDSITLNHTYTVDIPPLPQQIPPNVVVNYQPPDNGNGLIVDSTKWVKVIDSLENVVDSFVTSFITSFTTSPKLLRGDFSSDTVSLDLFYPNGQLQAKTYPVNYKRFNYRFSNGEMSVQERVLEPDKFSLNNIAHHLFVGAGYDITQTPLASFDYEAEYRRLNANLQTNLLFPSTDPPILEVRARLRYKLK